MVKTISVIAVFLLTLVALSYFLIMGSGKPLNSDLSVIGQGKPVLALAYENYSPGGGEALNRLRKVRSDFDARLVFVVADMGTPPGREFAERYQLVSGEAMFMDQQGKQLQKTIIHTDELELRSRLESMLALVE
ncbi:MAG: Unknown protein [uncultured Thiotrichaceae bacterium]|uniref:Thioredoxin domain-containing protein n=1 Tax=uncultured Thiotrichaceae bacterium TaxID=298394 RepID=A0A6S6SDZ0_9GAMM|nr:MAG: Unknown protein [uncultured Thiotrichaceae bacterium]